MEIIFYLHASIAIILMGFSMLTPHVVHALLYAVMSLLCLAVSMYSLSAHLAAALEVIIYAGAIMVLFVFAVMLLKVPAAIKKTAFKKQEIALFLLVFGLFWADLVLVLMSSGFFPQTVPATQSIKDIAHALFGTYGFMIEVISFVLLGGLVTALFLGQGFMHHKRPVEVVRHDPT